MSGAPVKRGLDVVMALAGLVLLFPLMLLIALWVRLDSRGPALHWSRRFGADGALFAMPKFRTMRFDTPDVATDDLQSPEHWITKAGRWLRLTSLDELPQLWSVLTGRMSLVGPRPALHSQSELMAMRAANGADRLRPGLTGWAQVSGRDVISLADKAALDGEYARLRSFSMDLKIMAKTIGVVLARDGLTH